MFVYNMENFSNENIGSVKRKDRINYDNNMFIFIFLCKYVINFNLWLDLWGVNIYVLWEQNFVNWISLQAHDLQYSVSLPA